MLTRLLLACLLLTVPTACGDDDEPGDAVDAAVDAATQAPADTTVDAGTDAAMDAFDPAICATDFVVSGCPCDGTEETVCCGGEDALSCVDGSWRFMRMRRCHPSVAADAGTERPRRAQCDFAP